MMRDDGTISMPFGFAFVDATLATNLFGATPTEQVIDCSASTRARIIAAISRGRPSRRTAPDTSRNASSSDNGSTAGVMSRKIAITPSDTSA